jgi:hypothetical protein
MTIFFYDCVESSETNMGPFFICYPFIYLYSFLFYWWTCVSSFLHGVEKPFIVWSCFGSHKAVVDLRQNSHLFSFGQCSSFLVFLYHSNKKPLPSACVEHPCQFFSLIFSTWFIQKKTFLSTNKNTFLALQYLIQE